MWPVPGCAPASAIRVRHAARFALTCDICRAYDATDVAHRRRGAGDGKSLRYIYSATTSHAVAKRTALQQYLQTFFGGSLRQMMTAFVREGSWSDEDLAALRVEIDRVRKQRKKEHA